MRNCEFCGERHNGNTIHRFIGEDGIELITKEEAQKVIAGQRKINLGFIPALK